MSNGSYGRMAAATFSGIYMITNLTNGKIYIGQSKNIYKRKIQHFTALRSGKHENHGMQQDWNVNSGAGFRWDVVEFCSLEKLNEREQYWIEYFNSFEPHGYNQGWAPYKRKSSKECKIKGCYKQKHYHKTR